MNSISELVNMHNFPGGIARPDVDAHLAVSPPAAAPSVAVAGVALGSYTSVVSPGFPELFQ